jgi:hypothetical protein
MSVSVTQSTESPLVYGLIPTLGTNPSLGK